MHGQIGCQGKRKSKKLLKQIGKLNARYVKDYEEAVSSVTEDLKKENIYLVSNSEVTPEQLQFIQSFYKEKLNGLIVPYGSQPLSYWITKTMKIFTWL